MQVAHVYLRKGKLFALGKKGPGGVLIDSGAPFVADATVEGMVAALAHALAASIIPFDIPPSFDLAALVSPIPAAAGVSERTFFNQARMGIVRVLADKTEILRGWQVGRGGWHAKVLEILPSTASPLEVATTMLSVLNE